MEIPRLSAGFSSSSLSIFLLRFELEIKQAPVHLKRALYKHTHTHTHTHSHVITTPFYLDLLFFLLKYKKGRQVYLQKSMAGTVHNF